MKPTRLSFLIISGALSCIIIIFSVTSISFQLLRSMSGDWRPAIVIFAFLLPLFIHAGLLVQFGRKNYPSTEVPKSLRVLLTISVVLAAIFVAFVSFGMAYTFAVESERRSFGSFFRSTIGKVFVLTLFVLTLSQIHLLVEGRWLMKTIKKNVRANLMQSI